MTKQITTEKDLTGLNFCLPNSFLVRMEDKLVPKAESAEDLMKAYEEQLNANAQGKNNAQDIRSIQNMICAEVVSFGKGANGEGIKEIVFRPQHAIKLCQANSNESLYTILDELVMFKK